MFIAVLQYGKRLHRSDKVAILDTDDGTIEIVDTTELDKFDIVVENYSYADHKPYTPCLVYTLGVAGNISFTIDISTDIDIFKFFEYTLKIIDGYVIYKNHTLSIPKYAFMDDFAYAFRFKDYLILRFNAWKYGGWYTIAIDSECEVAKWGLNINNKETMFVSGFKAIMTQVDTLSEV